MSISSLFWMKLLKQMYKVCEHKLSILIGKYLAQEFLVSVRITL